MATDQGARSDDQPARQLETGTRVRSFGWSDMFVRPEDDPRSDTASGGERGVLTSYLRDYRLTIELKCSGLDADGMARRSVEPSNLSLLGLIRHLADVERHWFRRVLRSAVERAIAIAILPVDPGDVLTVGVGNLAK